MNKAIAEGVKLVPELERVCASQVFEDSSVYLSKAKLRAVIAALTAAGEMERELAEAREALKPFAEQAKTHSDKMPDEMFIDDYEQHDKSKWTSHAGLRVGDLRRAARALETKGKQ